MSKFERKEFTDRRMQSASCPLCSNDLRVVKPEASPWGEHGFFQCDSCGCVVQINNMLEQPLIWQEFERIVNGSVYFSLREIVADKSHFPMMPQKDGSIRPVKAPKEKVDCQGCPGTFELRSNAKSDLQTRFCPDCRKNGVAQGVLDAEKAAVKRQKAAKKAAATRKRNASKKGTSK
jgi:uncharacterized protein YbaR (Trm112 family)/Zn-finger nucleic acid-binding protein